jgi:hypothetical protein
MYASFRGSEEDSNVHTVIRPPNWGVPFEIMCDISDFAIGVVLGQCIDNSPMSSTMRAKL